MLLRYSLACMGAGLCLWVGPVVSETAKPAPKPFPEFKAKRIGVPTTPIGKRITVQIDEPAPVIAAAAPPAKAPGAKAPATIGRYAWFWDKVSPDITQSGPGRLDTALLALRTNGPVAAPRMQAMQDIARAQGGRKGCAKRNRVTGPLQ